MDKDLLEHLDAREAEEVAKEAAEAKNPGQNPSQRMSAATMDPELRKKEAKQKFKIIFLSQIIQFVEVRE